LTSTLRLWTRGRPGEDLSEGSRPHRLVTAFPEFLAKLDLSEALPSLLQLLEDVEIHTSLLPYFALFDARHYRFVSVMYHAKRIDIAYGLYQELLDTGDDEQFFMLVLSQLLELLHPAAPHPDTTTATLVRSPYLCAHRGTRGLIATQHGLIEKLLAQRKVESILRQYINESALSSDDRDFLRDVMLSDLGAATLTRLDRDDPDTVLDERLRLLAQVYPDLCQPGRNALHIEGSLLGQLWGTYIPVAEWIGEQVLIRRERDPETAYVLGLTGAQGSGKTTLSRILSALLRAQSFRTVGFSLDDLYKTHAQRKELKKSCRYFRFRGPPGTHDVALGLDVIRQLRRNHKDGFVRIPVFDKSLHNGDGDRLAEREWRTIRGKADIVIFEGWCVGAQAADADSLRIPINRIEASSIYDDHAGTFRMRINEELRHYEPLFGECDDLIVLQVPNANSIYRWRQLQEAQLTASKGAGMQADTVRRFVDYYLPTTERYVLPLGEDPEKGASLVLTLGEDHAIRSIKRFERAAGVPEAEGRTFLSSAAEQDVLALFHDPRRDIDRDTGTAIVVMDGVGEAPLNEDNPLFYCDTPMLDELASLSRLREPKRAQHADASGGRPEAERSRMFARGTTVMGTTIHAASEELGLKNGQPGDSAVGHAALAVGGYQRKYIGLIWEAIKNGSFASNEAVRRPIEHVIEMRAVYPRPKLHLWGLCSRGYIHSDIDILFEIMKLAAERGLQREAVIVHAVTDGKDVPKDTAGAYIEELEEKCRQLGVGVIGTICGRDGWMCNRDRRFSRGRNAPAAQAVIYGKGVAPDSPTAQEAICQARQGPCGQKYGEDIDRFLEPTHIAGVPSCIEAGDAVLCFNLREDRSIIFPESFLFPLIDKDELRDVLYATLIELRTLKTPRPYHLVGFRQREPRERAPMHLLRAGFVVKTFAESEKGNEVSKGYFGDDIQALRKRMGALSVLLQVDTDLYPTSPPDPRTVPEMNAERVTALLTEAMGEGVALLGNLCNGDVIGHYGDKQATMLSMAVVDRQVRRIMEAAQAKGVILLITADHGCAESWGPMHTANQVPFYAVFPRQHGERARRRIIGEGVKALTDMEPTRFMLLGIPQPEHITGDSIIIPDITEWSEAEVTRELLAEAAKNHFALLRRCPDAKRIRRIMAELCRFRDREVVRMFTLRLHARLKALRRAECPFITEFLKRIPADLLPRGWATVPREADRDRIGARDASRRSMKAVTTSRPAS
jgi:bisphosphoglycerate-independent phosphoglycerate mutase